MFNGTLFSGLGIVVIFSIGIFTGGILVLSLSLIIGFTGSGFTGGSNPL